VEKHPGGYLLMHFLLAEKIKAADLIDPSHTWCGSKGFRVWFIQNLYDCLTQKLKQNGKNYQLQRAFIQ
jgi:hypothetical protein